MALDPLPEEVTGPVGAAQTLTAQIGGTGARLSDDEVRRFVRDQLAGAGLEGTSVCLLVPDATRTCPLPLLLSAAREALQGRASRLSVLIALGTHAPMGAEQIAAHLGPGAGGVEVRNHEWWDPAALVTVGTVPADRMETLSEGRLRQAVDVRVNRAVVEHDAVVVVGPVFPHEVVGFSGGNKYLFPGVSGPELIDVSHWLGALITSAAIIGTTGTTPVRALIDEAAAMVPARRLAVCVVTAPGGALHSVAFGEPEAAWAAAAAVSARTHVRYLDAPVRRVLSVLPARYDDLWTGAKGFYKVEPVVADGGEVVIYAPHITEISATHPAVAQIGYHCRDFFAGQWDLYRHHRWSDLAHSTHLAGAGTFDPALGEHLRVRVTLATGIPEDVARSVNLGYLDPRLVDPEEWAGSPDTLVVRNAGEDLYRLAGRP